MSRRLFEVTATTVLVVALALGGPASSAGKRPKPGKLGSWSKPFAEDPLFAKRPPKNIKESKKTPPAVSMAMLPDGRVIYWGGLEGIEGGQNPIALDGGRALINSRSRILDLRGNRARFSTPRLQDGGVHDLFCADQRLLPDGRLIAVGGTIWRPDPVNLGPEAGGTVELFGSNSVRVFDPKQDSWTRAPHFMHDYRWYPTMITMGSGKMLVVSGVSRLLYNFRGTNVHETETYDPATGKFKDNGGDGATTLPLFARLHLLPNGKVFYNGVGQMWGPFGQGTDEALWNVHKAYDPKKNTWTTTGMGAFGARSGAFSVLMPLKPPYKKADILVAGGTLGTSPGSYLANNLSEIITVKGGSSSGRRVADMNHHRWYSSGVLLPDGNVIAVSGADKDEVIAPGTETPVRQAELFNGKKWIPLSRGGRVRTYHNSAMLLPDGSILVGGHSPINTLYGPKADNSGRDLTKTNNLKDPSFEIFRPPYLFDGNRPSINRVQEGIAWDRSFDIQTGDADKVEKVVLQHLPTVTHITDADQRSVELEFSRVDGNTLRAAAPPNGNVAPPGYYYVWILDGDGTPSKAHIVHVGSRSMGGSARAPMGK